MECEKTIVLVICFEGLLPPYLSGNKGENGVLIRLAKGTADTHGFATDTDKGISQKRMTALVKATH